MTQIPDRAAGFRKGVRWAIRWLHDEADTMNDPHARQVLNNAAYAIGVALRDKIKGQVKSDPALDPELARLLLASKDYVMTTEEAFEQRVSFVYGQLPDESPLTKEQVREYLKSIR